MSRDAKRKHQGSSKNPKGEKKPKDSPCYRGEHTGKYEKETPTTSNKKAPPTRKKETSTKKTKKPEKPMWEPPASMSEADRKILTTPRHPEGFSVYQPTEHTWIAQGSLPPELRMTPEVFAELSQLDPKKPETFMSYGKLCSFHVTFRNYGEDYPFAGKDHPGEELKHPYLQRLLAWCKEQSGCNMNQLLLNFYADESKHLGWHSDNDAFQPGFPPVYSFSFGAERTFEVARKVPSPTRKDLLRSFTMKDNTLLIMGGACQLQCKHRVPPPRHGVRKGMRLNVTVRAIVPETPAQKARKASAKLTREVRKAKKEAQEAEDSLRKDPLFAVLEKLDSSPT